MSIKVILCEPGKKARVAEIGTELEDLQAVVEGDIEACYPFEDPVCIVYNDEGKFNGCLPNRAVYDEETHEIMDVIFGTFFICGVGGEEFSSLTETQLIKYGEIFQLPEQVMSLNGNIVALAYDPDAIGGEER